MRLLENKIPPLLIIIFFSLITWWLSTVFNTIEVSDFSRLFVSSVIALLAVFFGISGVVSFHRAKTTVNPLKPETASSLVSSGIYRISRNPMYVGLALLLVAMAVFLSSPMSLLGVAGFILYMNQFQIKPEERVLNDMFGEEYINYKAKVRRWL